MAALAGVAALLVNAEQPAFAAAAAPAAQGAALEQLLQQQKEGKGQHVYERLIILGMSTSWLTFLPTDLSIHSEKMRSQGANH